MHVAFLGAAGTVTGSMHLVHVAGQKILLDCGLFQGPRRERQKRNRELPILPHELDAVVLSHAPIDQSGALPVLAKHDFGGTVNATPATRDLCAVMQEDAADIQVSDALDLMEDERAVRLVFSGDLGRHGTPLLRDPEVPTGAQAVIVESTYGDRLHLPRPVSA